MHHPIFSLKPHDKRYYRLPPEVPEVVPRVEITHAFVALQRGSATTAHDAAATAGLTVLTSRAPSRTLPRRRASRARGAARQQIGRKRPRLLFSTCVACRSGCAECTSRTPGGKPIGRCRRLLLLYASHTCANHVLMLRAARARCTG